MTNSKRNPSQVLKEAKSDAQLAEEVLEGALNPDLYNEGRRALPEGGEGGEEGDGEEEEEDEDVFVSIRLLLESALNSGKLRSLARATVLAWQAGYDSALLRQAEPKMVRKAQETRLAGKLRKAINDRSLTMLNDCFAKAASLSLSPDSFPELVEARALERELEEEAARLHEEAKPERDRLMNSVIKEFKLGIHGSDIDALQVEVIAEAEVAKEALESNMKTLTESLELLATVRGQSSSVEKLNDLNKLNADLKRINPRNMETRIDQLTDELDNLRAGSTEMSLTYDERETLMKGLQDRVAELEAESEEMRQRASDAAQLGAKWMEEKKNAEIEALKAEADERVEKARAEATAELEADFKRKSCDLAKSEKRAKVLALQGLEDSLHNKHRDEINRLETRHQASVEALELELEAAHNRVRSLEKIIQMRG